LRGRASRPRRRALERAAAVVLKKPIMNAFRATHHYLFDVEFGPPGRTPYASRRPSASAS
jgi:hypothetical protein